MQSYGQVSTADIILRGHLYLIQPHPKTELNYPFKPLEDSDRFAQIKIWILTLSPADPSHPNTPNRPIIVDLSQPDIQPIDSYSYSRPPGRDLQADVLESLQPMGTTMPYNYGYKQIVHMV